MCRWIAYFCSPIRPRALLYDTPHGLVEQSRRDRLAGGYPNADGFGLGSSLFQPGWPVSRVAEQARLSAEAFDAMHGVRAA